MPTLLHQRTKWAKEIIYCTGKDKRFEVSCVIDWYPYSAISFKQPDTSCSDDAVTSAAKASVGTGCISRQGKAFVIRFPQARCLDDLQHMKYTHGNHLTLLPACLMLIYRLVLSLDLD